MSRPGLVDTLLTVEKNIAVLSLNRHNIRNALTGSALLVEIDLAFDYIPECLNHVCCQVVGEGEYL